MFQKLSRDHRAVSVGLTNTQIAGPNYKRFALVLGLPAQTSQQFISDNTLVPGASTATTGVKASYTVPAGVQAILQSATMFGTTGTTQVAALQLVRGATTINLFAGTGSGNFLSPIPLQAGDVVQWNVTTAVAASVTDFSINVQRERVPTRVTVEFARAAVLDQGITYGPLSTPFELLFEHVGQAIREEVNAIASVAATTIGVLDIFWP